VVAEASGIWAYLGAHAGMEVILQWGLKARMARYAPSDRASGRNTIRKREEERDDGKLTAPRPPPYTTAGSRWVRVLGAAALLVAALGGVIFFTRTRGEHDANPRSLVLLEPRGFLSTVARGCVDVTWSSPRPWERPEGASGSGSIISQLLDQGSFCMGPENAKIAMVTLVAGDLPTIDYGKWSMLNRLHLVISQASGPFPIRVCIATERIETLRSLQWQKVSWALFVAQAFPELEWIWHLEADAALVLRGDGRDAERLVERLLQQVQDEAKARLSALTGDAPQSVHPWYFVSNDFHEPGGADGDTVPLGTNFETVNTGSWFLRNGPEAREFLQFWHNAYPAQWAYTHPWHEQRSMVEMLKDYPGVFRSQVPLLPSVLFNKWSETMSAGFESGRVADYLRGTAVVHWAGRGAAKRNTQLPELVRQVGLWSEAPSECMEPDSTTCSVMALAEKWDLKVTVAKVGGLDHFEEAILRLLGERAATVGGEGEGGVNVERELGLHSMLLSTGVGANGRGVNPQLCPAMNRLVVRGQRCWDSLDWVEVEAHTGLSRREAHMLDVTPEGRMELLERTRDWIGMYGTSCGSFVASEELERAEWIAAMRA